MPPVPLSKLASDFVRRFRAICPDGQNFIVREVLRGRVGVLCLQVFQLLQYLCSSLSIHNAEPALYLKRQFDNNFSHGDLLFQV